MKLGVSACLWVADFTDRDLGLIAKAREFGFEVFDIPVFSGEAFDISTTRAACERADIEPILATPASPERDLIDADPEVRARGQQHLRDFIDLIVALGGNLVTGPFCAAPLRFWLSDGRQKQANLERCVQSLKPVLTYAVDKGVRLAFEPINRHESSFINRVQDAVQLADAVDSTSFGLVLDTYHLNIEEKSFSRAIEQAGHRLLHFHACANDRGTPGAGHIPWDEIARSLKKIDYAGHMSIESFTDQSEALARACSIWRPIEPDMDRMAREGQIFLRRLTESAGLKYPIGLPRRRRNFIMNDTALTARCTIL